MTQLLSRRARRARARLCAVFASSRSAPRCSTKPAVCMPAATSRTPPTRKASAPRPRRWRTWCSPGGTRVLAVGGGRRWPTRPSRRAAAAARSCASSPPTTRRSGAPTCSEVRGRYTLGELLPASFGPAHLAIDHERRSQAIERQRRAHPRRAGRARRRVAVRARLRLGRRRRRWSRRRTTSPMPSCPPSRRWASAGHAGMLRLGRHRRRARSRVLRGRKHAYESGDAAAMKGADPHAGRRSAAARSC